MWYSIVKRSVTSALGAVDMVDVYKCNSKCLEVCALRENELLWKELRLSHHYHRRLHSKRLGLVHIAELSLDIADCFMKLGSPT